MHVYSGPDTANAGTCAEVMTTSCLGAGVGGGGGCVEETAWVWGLKKRGRQRRASRVEAVRFHRLSNQAPVMDGHSVGLVRWLSREGVCCQG